MKTRLFLKIVRVAMFPCCLAAFACAPRQSTEPTASQHYLASEMVTTQPDEIRWNDLGLIPGVKIAVLNGNPAQPGHYVLRLKFPPNTRMPAHWHTGPEFATILAGTLLLGMGEKEDPSAMRSYKSGSFLVVPPRSAHYGRSEDEVIFELSGPGPYEVVFVNPADDPRKNQKP